MRRTELKRTSELRRGSSRLKRTPFGRASAEQKAKVERQGCRVSGALYGEWPIDPAHVTPRAIGGCDDPLCVVGLRRDLHRLYDDGELDILPYLTLDEQAHAVKHLGILGALKRTTGDDYEVAA
jgi:hypothetical protein